MSHQCSYQQCTNKGIHKCSNCSIAYYCSKEHQKSDWKLKHKLECFPLELSKNEFIQVLYDEKTQTRSIIAKKDISAGEIICKGDLVLVSKSYKYTSLTTLHQ